MKKRPVLIHLSRVAHLVVNRLAWKFANDSSKGSEDRDKHWLWRLNNWVAKPSVDWYVYKQTGKTREEWRSK